MPLSLREAALAYRRRDWSVIPIAPSTKVPPKGFELEQFFHRLPTEQEIEQWWRRWPQAGVGIITGKVSNIIVLDVDTRKGADANFIYETYPTGTIARTGSGGGHFFYEYPKHLDHVPNVVGKEHGKPNGLDLRADGGYVVSAPTLHPSGQRYEWISTGRPRAISSALLAKVLPKAVARNGDAPLSTEPWLSDVLAGVDEGGRNDAAARLAGYYFKKGMPADVVEQQLILWNKENRPPLTPGRLRLTVESIQRTRQRNRTAQSQPPARDTQDTEQDVFQLLSLRQYMAVFGENEMAWAIENWLPDQTIAMLVSPPGTFKTWILLDLAVSLATGTDFLGLAPITRSGPVLLVQQEDFHGEIAERTATIIAQRFPMGVSSTTPDHFDICLPPNPPIYLHPNRELRFENPEVMDALEARIKEIRPIAVLIDPLYSAADIADFMSGAVKDMMRLKQMRDRYGCSFVLAHHTGKRSQESNREDVWGSQFVNAFLETGWQIRPKAANAAVVRRHFKVAKNIEESVLTFDIDTTVQPPIYKPSLMDTDQEDMTAGSRILQLLEEEGPLPQALIVKRIDLDKSTVSRAIQRLTVERLILMGRDNRLRPSDSFDVG